MKVRDVIKDLERDGLRLDRTRAFIGSSRPGMKSSERCRRRSPSI